MTRASDPPGAPDLLRSVGLLPDGPVLWGRPVPASGPGVLIVELPAPLPAAPLELTRVGKWIERVPDLRLDGERPTSKALAARLASFWLPDQTVLFLAGAPGTVGGRVAALQRTVLGDRRPYAAGHWLHTLRGLEAVRIWWALTDATEEYEDALLGAFADGVGDAAAGLPEPALVLPWAVLRRPTGERRGHGITGPLLPEPAAPTAPTITRREVPAAAADGTEPPVPRLGGVRVTSPPSAARARRTATTGGAGRSPARSAATASGPASGRAPTPLELSQEGHDRLQAELHELRAMRRPAAIRRVAAARELGDLRENSEYHAAREELGFVEGRIQQLESRLRHAVVVAEVAGDTAQLGSQVVVETAGETETYRLVSSAEADPAAGRISTSSPVGRALLGHGAGSEVVLTTPGGSEVRYRIIEVS